MGNGGREFKLQLSVDGRPSGKCFEMDVPLSVEKPVDDGLESLTDLEVAPSDPAGGAVLTRFGGLREAKTIDIVVD